MAQERLNIPEMSDADFLSYLYSERDRENNISQHQGWNNWALIGAIVAVLCAGYSALYNAGHGDLLRIAYYTSGTVAFYMSYRAWIRLLIERDRGYDFSRVRFLKEVAPWADSVISIIVSIFCLITIAIHNDASYLIGLWGFICLTYISVTIWALINRNRPVQFSLQRGYFVKMRWNNVFDLIVGIGYSQAWYCSFKRASWNILNPEFQVGICLAAFFILVYLFIVINTNNREAKQFDKIVDKYLYCGQSKEETYQAIFRNRMGYGVLDVCEKELKIVQEMSSVCVSTAGRYDQLRSKLEMGTYDAKDIVNDRERVKSTLDYIEKALEQSKKLTKRLGEIMKVSPVINQMPDIQRVCKANDELFSKVCKIQETLKDVIPMLNRYIVGNQC